MPRVKKPRSSDAACLSVPVRKSRGHAPVGQRASSSLLPVWCVPRGEWPIRPRSPCRSRTRAVASASASASTTSAGNRAGSRSDKGGWRFIYSSVACGRPLGVVLRTRCRRSKRQSPAGVREAPVPEGSDIDKGSVPGSAITFDPSATQRPAEGGFLRCQMS